MREWQIASQSNNHAHIDEFHNTDFPNFVRQKIQHDSQQFILKRNLLIHRAGANTTTNSSVRTKSDFFFSFSNVHLSSPFL